jgi:hypothetical protein
MAVAKELQLPGKNLSVQFDLVGEALPFANFESYSVGTEPVRMTKLEMAARVADSINFEFFQDTNGMFVFKPPFYNLDVTRNAVYCIKAEDIISIDLAEDASQVITYLEASGPIIQTNEAGSYTAYHIDFALMEKFGIRERTVNLTFGSNPKVLRAMACSEMAKANSNAFTANITIAHRPELRIGYPVYIDHLDVFYYIKAINHSVAFGTSSTTSLTLSARRSRVYDDNGNLMRGYIYKSLQNLTYNQEGAATSEEILGAIKKDLKGKDEAKTQAKKEQEAVDSQGTRSAPVNSSYTKNISALDKVSKTNNLLSSPSPGFWRPVQSNAFAKFSNLSSDATGGNILEQLKAGKLTELVRYVDGDEEATGGADSSSTVPYTDVNGFQHIGGFPYGATYILAEDSTIKEASSSSQSTAEAIQNLNLVDSVPPLISLDNTSTKNNPADTTPFIDNYYSSSLKSALGLGSKP